MTNAAQETRAAEGLLHCVHTKPPGFHLATTHREQSSDSQTQQRGLQIHSLSRLLRAPHCYFVSKTHHNEHVQIWY